MGSRVLVAALTVALGATIASAVVNSSELTSCKHPDLPPAEMILTIALDVVGRRWRTTTVGPLANQQVGVCMKSEVDRLLTTITIPPDVASFPDLEIPFRNP